MASLFVLSALRLPLCGTNFSYTYVRKVMLVFPLVNHDSANTRLRNGQR